jgi:hypothetical protein
MSRMSQSKGSAPKTRRFDQKKGVRKLARERVGTVPPSKVIEPKPLRKKPKHRRPVGEEETE